VLSILPLAALLIVAGGFGILVESIGYRTVFLILGIFISLSGVLGIFLIKDSDTLKRSGSLGDIAYGFRPSVVKSNKPFYICLVLILIYGIACQIFMPYLIIYMKTYLGFTVIEYSAVFALAILIGAAVNLYLTRLSDRMDKTKLLYFAEGIFALGLFLMYICRGVGKSALLVLFGISGFVMITGYIFISALIGSLLRDNTPADKVGKLQGVRMVFQVLIPMIVGPTIGNLINSIRNIPLPDIESSDAMTTSYIPAPEIFIAAFAVALLLFAATPILQRSKKRNL
jgi:MFS family permease